GPFSLEEIKRDLANQRYQDSDYWAWYEGLDSWVPLHELERLLPATDPGSPSDTPVSEEEHTAPAESAAAAECGQAEQEPGPGIPSGLPFAALEQMFVFTSGEGRTVMESPITRDLCQKVIGEDWARIRDTVPRDVFGRCNIGEQLRRDGSVPSSAWKAMSALKPDIINGARGGAYRVGVRN